VKGGDCLDKTEIKEIREKLDMTQDQFASFLGIAGSTLRNWEQGRAGISSLVAEGIRAKTKYLTGKAA
jgi:DNA-binding transcriptional regulator YiaG